MTHSSGESGVTIGVDEQGGSRGLHNASGEITTFITNTEYGGGVSIANKTGEEIIHIGADKYGNGRVRAYNRKGKGRTLQPGP